MREGKNDFSTTVDELLEDSDRIFHLAVTRHQIKLNERMRRWERKAKKWIWKQFLKGAECATVRVTVEKRRKQLRAMIRISTAVKMTEEELKQADRDFEILQCSKLQN